MRPEHVIVALRAALGADLARRAVTPRDRVLQDIVTACLEAYFEHTA